MEAFEVVLVIVGLLALVGISIMIFRALMRPVVVLGTIALLGWMLFFYQNMVDTQSKDVIINEQTEQQEGK